MERTWKEINETIVSENDLMSLTKSHNVSVYRRENFKNYESITYRCSQYRTFTKCQYQLKAKIYHDGTYQIFYSQHHEHFKQWLGSARLLNYSNMLPPIFCSCKYGLKEYSCIHTIGLMMIWGVRPIPQLIGKRNPKGRRKKVKYALSKD
ncbi:unnamed protein product [Rotaria sp. Silwood1]|nr:unnamed protein product [Rotaria sp. Silwood1]CAF3836444.1 unnamed protein product [Rotaria sp. Silwood1]CAF4940996.1 unnamed protein product [Rotaria sp. Silwood1]